MSYPGLPAVPMTRRLVVRESKKVTEEQRARCLKATEYNVFSFPAPLLYVDYLSDSGSTAMYDFQWAALFHGDESYGRNAGYYVLLDTLRDTFERGDKPKDLMKFIQTNESNVDKLMDEMYLVSEEGGFVNGGVHQLQRPNCFITPQGRCAEHLLFSTLRTVLDEMNGAGKKYYFASNGWFDTTGAHVGSNKFVPINLFQAETILNQFTNYSTWRTNPFQGNMDVKALEELIVEKGADAVPLIVLTITNNSCGGQPVSMKNMREVKAVADKYNIPLFFDACRFAENALFIQRFEEGYGSRSIASIVQECFALCDGFTISLKKDGVANIGGALCLRDRGNFHKKYSINNIDVGVRLKEAQILNYGNDSYGGLSGRDIMALACGLKKVLDVNYLTERVDQVRYFCDSLQESGIPAIAGGHAVYLDVNTFFKGSHLKPGDFAGVGLTVELIKRFGIRGCELGEFAFEWDMKSEEELKSCVLNLVRFAVPRMAYTKEHIDYTVAAIKYLHQHRELVPKASISRGRELRLRHFQSGLTVEYKN
eukprot:GCRY01001003.1.p1 GENE.GCRY01001003.1~~GCRY01001003.1.p1  ORF type:complete len:538 (+),score=110.59 GCRY01001003.1:121-1734(+)